MTPIPTVHSSFNDWLAMIQRSKSRSTWKTYKSASSIFKQLVTRKDKPLQELSAKDYEVFIQKLKTYHPRTEKLYATIIALYFEYLSAKNLRRINMDSIRFTRRNETRKVGKRLRRMDMPSITQIAKQVAKIKPGKSLLLHRAKTLVLFLCRGGLRAFEAVGLKTGNLDRAHLRGTVIGKGNKEGRFVFDKDCLSALDEYRSHHKVKTDWLFLSHSRRHMKEAPHPISTDTSLRDVVLIVSLVLENEPAYKITPHQFRHYFVTKIHREKGLKMAQTLARHENIDTTQNYIHVEDEDVDIVER